VSSGVQKLGTRRTETKDLKFLVRVHYAIVRLVLVRYLRADSGEREVLSISLAQLLLAKAGLAAIEHKIGAEFATIELLRAAIDYNNVVT